MPNYRVIEVGCFRELHLVAASDTDVLDSATVATFTAPDDVPPWLCRTLDAFNTWRRARGMLLFG